jgi:hypothetical protein
MAQGSSKVATGAAESSVPFVPSIIKSLAATGAAIVMIISKRIIKRIDMNPFSVFTNLKTKGAFTAVEAPLNLSKGFLSSPITHLNGFD